MQHTKLTILGEGPSLLLLPGWNTPSAFLEASLPSWFLARWRCVLLEWPGLGVRSSEGPPRDLESLLNEIENAQAYGPFHGVIGFCLGGVLAWERARNCPTHPPLFLVESPYHFPMALAPLLVPGLGPLFFQAFTRISLLRRALEATLFSGERAVPEHFWGSFGGNDATVVCRYLKLLNRYAWNLSCDPDPPPCSCHRLVGVDSPLVLRWPWGRVHRIQAKEWHIEGAGHFPAVEAPERFFKQLDRLVRQAN